MPEHSHADALRVAKELGWRIFPPNKNGYQKLACPCGRHLKWLHKTPSNPNHFKEAIAYLRRACSRAPVLIDLAKGQEVRRKHKIQGSQGT